MNARSWSYFFLSLCIATTLCAKNDKQTISVAAQDSLHSKKQDARTRRARKQVIKKTKKSGRNYISHMEYNELALMQEKAINQKNNHFAIKCTEQLIKICTDSSKQPQLLLQLANLHFENGDFQEAVRWYSEFALLYPGRPAKELEFAAYQAIRAQQKLIMTIDRDQTNTEQLIAMTDEFLSHMHFKKFRVQVSEIRHSAYQKLIQSELYICSFYSNRGDTRAAQRRIDFVRDHYSGHIGDLEKQIIMAENSIHTQTPQITIQQVKEATPIVAENIAPHTPMKHKF